MDRYGNGEELVLENVFTSPSDGLSFARFNKKLLTGDLSNSPDCLQLHPGHSMMLMSLVLSSV